MRAAQACLISAVIGLVVLASPAPGAERELEEAPPPNSARKIETAIQQIVTKPPERRQALFPWLRKPLERLPAFFADTFLEARFRTYYLREDRTTGVLSEAWAMGGSVYYRSGWLEDLFQVEVEGFTSQPIFAPEGRDGTQLLAAEQEGYSALAIANGKLRYKGIQLTGYRQYLDLPYLNRNDSRMTPNTFEAITLQKPEGEFKFTTGYAWRIKLRTSEEFVSLSGAAGLEAERGSAFIGAIWDPNEDFHGGVYAGVVPDLGGKVYGEMGVGSDLAGGWHGRIDGQFTYQFEIGEDLLGDAGEENWNLGIRAAGSYAGAVFRLGLAFAGPNQDTEFFGSNPSYVGLMQRTFNRPHEKALLVSASYDFSALGVGGLSAIMNFAAGFDGEVDGTRSDAQEVDVTLGYRVDKGWLKSFWLRVRGSWLNDDSADRDGTEVRVILRYDFPVI
jgi:hypothetical protein